MHTHTLTHTRTHTYKFNLFSEMLNLQKYLHQLFVTYDPSIVVDVLKRSKRIKGLCG